MAMQSTCTYTLLVKKFLQTNNCWLSAGSEKGWIVSTRFAPFSKKEAKPTHSALVSHTGVQRVREPLVVLTGGFLVPRTRAQRPDELAALCENHAQFLAQALDAELGLAHADALQSVGRRAVDAHAFVDGAGVVWVRVSHAAFEGLAAGRVSRTSLVLRFEASPVAAFGRLAFLVAVGAVVGEEGADFIQVEADRWCKSGCRVAISRVVSGLICRA
jgi:hypothetical protein